MNVEFAFSIGQSVRVGSDLRGKVQGLWVDECGNNKVSVRWWSSKEETYKDRWFREDEVEAPG